MSFLLRLFKKGPRADELFIAGMDAFSHKDYSQAYLLFMRAFKTTNNKRTQINSLTNAASAKEHLGDLLESSMLLLETANLKAAIENLKAAIEIRAVMSIRESLRKAFNLCSKSKNPDKLAVIAAQLMFYSIATKELSLAGRLYQKLEESSSSHSMTDFAKKLYQLLQDRSPDIWDQDKELFKLPSSFSNHKYLINMVNVVIKSTSALSIELKSASSKNHVKVGETISVSLVIKNFTPLTIKRIFLNPGGKGIITGGLPEGEKISLNSNEEINYEFDVEAQIGPGTWIVGPVQVVYTIHGQEYELSYQTIKLEVQEGEKSLDLGLEVDVIEEDFEFEAFSTLKNTGKTIIENLKVILKIPGEGVAKITSGIPEKTIFSLSPGDEINFSNKIRFDAGILGKKYLLKLIASFEGTDPIEKKYIIDGEMH